jgi:hypothetical protein
LETRLLIDSLECEFRAVAIDRLGAVLQDGIDVYPTTNVIYAEFSSKALEYGGWPKVLLALRRDSLHRTFREVPADISEEDLEEVRREFPTIIKSVDGSKLWCTRLSEDDPRIASSYEVAYAWWIPGDAWSALKSVFILVRPEDDENFLSAYKQVKTMFASWPEIWELRKLGPGEPRIPQRGHRHQPAVHGHLSVLGQMELVFPNTT